MSTDTRTQIVETAADMMALRGYAAVGVAEVCRALDLKRSVVTREFGTKCDLGAAVVAHFSSQRLALLERALHPDLPVRGQIQRMFARLHEEQIAAQQRLGVTPGSPFALFAEGGDDGVRLREAVRDALDAWRDRIILTLGAAARAGELHLPNPAYPARAIVAFAEGALELARALDDPGIVRELAPASMSLLIDRRATGSWPLILASSGSFRAV